MQTFQYLGSDKNFLLCCLDCFSPLLQIIHTISVILTYIMYLKTISVWKIFLIHGEVVTAIACSLMRSCHLPFNLSCTHNRAGDHQCNGGRAVLSADIPYFTTSFSLLHFHGSFRNLRRSTRQVNWLTLSNTHSLTKLLLERLVMLKMEAYIYQPWANASIAR